ncbi:hypothetical protein [Bacteroides mediterraneensis]|uniref:TMhelix containing protein n=1 Tax=Bacteroides mediterraneensis TaxID=1841856 RepID=A0ABS2ESP1_9BACE|nr:hypothetical protein [Bacteroides mediterraneensis]MBM6757399.1 hypothetical protein [Bacteroides mediterraneensis]
MNKRTQIILFTSFSIILGPVIVLEFILKLTGKILDIMGWLCWMEPRMARKGWDELIKKIKESWNTN